MKKLVTVIMLATTTSLAGLAAAAPAVAATHRHQSQQQSVQAPVVGEGYYEGDREMRIDESDRASSPYAGGV